MGGKMHKRKPCKRVRRLDLSTTLSREDVKAVTVLALMETLVLDMQTFTPANTDQGRTLAGMLNLINQQNKSYIGAVDPHMIEFSDRYLCRVQIAFDGFFDAMTDHDRAEMERIKKEWGVGIGVDPMQEAVGS